MPRVENSGLHAIAPRDFRDVLSTVPTGVVVITAIEGSRPVGLVVGTFTSVSLDPPLVGFLPAASSTSFPRVLASGAFCANVLTHDQQDVCRAFAASGSDKFAGLSWQPAPVSGSPVLDGVAAWIDCSITAVHEAGDHLIVIGAVDHLAVAATSPSLVFYRGGYTRPHESSSDARPGLTSNGAKAL
ncbi:flavin reductase family protein [Mycolicibacterium nivoides]|uniref:flavin reductase family protein n=1 Tax=Mycolicibacterium nivoides TaxID=2487344 RepID=UPI003C30280D